MTIVMDELPKDWLFVTLSRIEDQQTRHAAEMRLGFQEIRTNAAAHELADSKVEARVTASEKAIADIAARALQTSASRQRIEVAVIAGAITAVIEGAKALFR